MGTKSTLPRLQEFLGSGYPIEVVAHPDQPESCNFGLRFMRSLAAPLAAVALVAATDASAQEVGADAMQSVQNIYAKYASHGKSEYSTIIQIDDNDSKQPPEALVSGRDKICLIHGIRPSYASFMTAVDTPLMRSFIVIHEDMHCRVAPYVLSNPGDRSAGKTDPLADHFADLTNESIADAMGVLMIAKRDGIEAAQQAMAQVRAIRVAGEETHDSRAALQIVSGMLEKRDWTQAPEGDVFAAAITAGVQGAVLAFPRQVPKANMAALSTASFKDQVTSLAKGLQTAAKVYANGPATKNEATFQAGSVVAKVRLDQSSPPGMVAIDTASQVYNAARIATMGMLAFADARNSMQDSFAARKPALEERQQSSYSVSALRPPQQENEVERPR